MGSESVVTKCQIELRRHILVQKLKNNPGHSGKRNCKLLFTYPWNRCWEQQS